MHGSEFDASVSSGLGLYFLVLALMNAYYSVRQIPGRDRSWVRWVWPGFSLLLTLLLFGSAIDFYQGRGIVLPQGFRDFVDGTIGPVLYFVVSVAGFACLLLFRRLFATTFVGWNLLNWSLILIGFSMTDTDFRAIIAKPDNVPISMLIYSVGFATWVALRQAVRNDDRISAGGKPLEADETDKVLTWPDLVYTELMAMVLCTVFLLVWSICLKAPLEPPASATDIPNPSKAPWYFLGLQEMLVYFDPWLAGVVLPTYIVLGLCAIPYIDYNKKGAGYYTFNERSFAITTFLFGFVVLWVVLIVLGTLLRGPNWNFFGPYEYWTPYKTESLINRFVSRMFWVDLLNRPLPDVILVREAPGILILLAYFFVTPMLLARGWLDWLFLKRIDFREMYIRMGLIRFMTMANILLMMAFLPIKMVLRWCFNLKYIVYISEYFFNV